VNVSPAAANPGLLGKFAAIVLVRAVRALGRAAASLAARALRGGSEATPVSHGHPIGRCFIVLRLYEPASSDESFLPLSRTGPSRLATYRKPPDINAADVAKGGIDQQRRWRAPEGDYCHEFIG